MPGGLALRESVVLDQRRRPDAADLRQLLVERHSAHEVVGSSLEREEEVFGKAYDPKIVRRIWAFVKPYRSQIYLSVAAVLVFTLTSLAFPLVIRYAIDNGMAQGGGGRRS